MDVSAYQEQHPFTLFVLASTLACSLFIYLLCGWNKRTNKENGSQAGGARHSQSVGAGSNISGVVVQSAGGQAQVIGEQHNHFYESPVNRGDQLGRIYKGHLKSNVLAICGEADAFREEKILEADLRITASSPNEEDREELLGSHRRENLIEFYYSKKQIGDISYRELFEELKQRVEDIPYKGGTPEAQQVFVRRHSNMAVIVGEPGVGKSSLTKRIVCEMLAEVDPLFNPDVVFFIRFRDVDYKKETDLLQFLDPKAEATYPKREERMHILKKLEKLDNVYIIMDGLDEANIELKLKASKFSSIHSEKKAAEFIEDLLNGNILLNSKKLVTSRPYAISKQFKVLFTIHGLTETGLQKICFDICDHDEGRCEMILNNLETHLDLKSYCFTPVICIMTMKTLNKSNLSSTEMSVENATKPSNMESMTAIFVCALKDWLYEEKDEKKFKLRNISLFAFSNFKRNKYFFENYELVEAEIERQGISNFFCKGGEILYFVHLMWQEFLVAVHFRLYTKQFEPNDIEKLSEESYKMVSRFLFGLCNEQTLGKLLNCVEKEEGRVNNIDRKRFKKELEQLVMKKLRRLQDTDNRSFNSFLPTLTWIREMGDPLFTTQAIKETAACLGDEIKIGDGSFHPILPADVLDIIRVLNQRDAELALVVSYPFFVGDSCERFFEKLPNVLQKKCNIHLKSLAIRNILIDDALLRFILSHHCIDKVEELILWRCNVSDEIVEELVVKIQKRTKKMRLHLIENPIYDAGAAKLLDCMGNLGYLEVARCLVSEGMKKLLDQTMEVGCGRYFE